jgi:acetoin utilization deacetylase AcuC-like enzyme
VPLPEGHRFPMTKYRLTREYLLANNILNESELYEPDIATADEILLCHSEDYYESFRTGSIDEKAIRRFGFHGVMIYSFAHLPQSAVHYLQQNLLWRMVLQEIYPEERIMHSEITVKDIVSSMILQL